MPEDANRKRRDLRFKTRFETLYSSDRQEGAGVLSDISYSGTLVTESSLRPCVGCLLRLYVFLQPVSPVELTGEVVRHTEDGFAVKFKSEDPEVRQLVDDIGALVAVPGEL